MPVDAHLPDAVARYAAHVDGLIELHLPSDCGEARPLVVLVHGGFWKQAYDRLHARPLARALAQQGYVVALPEYRRVGEGAEGGWPTTATDVEEALRRLPALLDGLGVVATSTTLIGHSAGGHLVLWLANQQHEVDRVVALAPVADLRFAAETGMGGGAAVALLGGTPDELPDVYDAADPATRLTARPLTHLSEPAAALATPRSDKLAVVIVHGDQDDDVDVESSRRLSATYPWVDYRELAGIGHMELIEPGSDAWPAVLEAIGG